MASRQLALGQTIPLGFGGGLDHFVAELRSLLDGPRFGLRLLLTNQRGHLRVIRVDGHPIDSGRRQAEARRLTLTDGISRTLEHVDGTAITIYPIDRRGDPLGVAEVSGPMATINGHRRELERVVGNVSATLRGEVDGDLRRRELQLGLAWTAHELRGPLHAVRILLEGAAISGQDGTGTTMLRAADELSRLADGLESVLHWAVGSGRIHVRKTDLVALTHDAVDSCVAETGEDRVLVEGCDRLHIRVDPLHMRSAIENLVRNALRYSTPGTKVRVTVELRDGEPTIEVDNEGSEISTKDRERIFDPMAVGENGLGTGLGLFIVSQVIERHGGTIRCSEGEEGHVSFELKLPSVNASSHPAPSPDL